MTFEIVETPRANGVLIVADHASAAVPDTLDLGVEAAPLTTHIASDLGVAATARRMVGQSGCAAFLACWSRLVVDLNRDVADPSVIPVTSDGVAIAGNVLTDEQRRVRLASYHAPYHDGLAALLEQSRPALIVSLHSFTPALSSRDEARPWHIGVLYNRIEAPSHAAIRWLRARGLTVGDQQPYSGKVLNATMDRHAEANGIPYVGIEVRQDQIADGAGQDRYVALLGDMAQHIVAGLASGAII